jgi:multiple sugar transport system substrate-binding protein
MRTGAIGRRALLQGGIGLTIANFMPWSAVDAFAAKEDDRIVAAARPLGGADLRGMIWSNYYLPMQPAMEEFKKLTGIGVGSIQDVSIFDVPQRAMAEAVSRSPHFDFFHCDSNMIPTLVSADVLEPLDAYMEKANFKIDAVGDFANFMAYKGSTYGIITDGNVHIHYLRKDLMESADNKKRFEDKHGKKLEFPQTWEDDLRLQQFFHNPDKDIAGSGSLRNRANGVTWWYMMFYSAGGFPFDDDVNPTIDNEAGNYALDVYLQEKKAAHPESATWGAPQMLPRIVGGRVASCQYWDRTARLNEDKEKSITVGKWLYGLVPGSDKSGKRIHRSISSPLPAIVVNRHSPRKAQAAYLALWWATLKHSTPIVADKVNPFHDAWHRGHFSAPSVIENYTSAGMKAIEANLQVVCPPIYLTGYLEFQDLLANNLFEAYVGQLPASEVLKRTTDEWNDVVNRIGRETLKQELASYKSLMPRKDKPA